MSVVCPSVRLSISFHIFSFFSRATGQILIILACTKYCEIPKPKWKYIDLFLKIFISRTIVQVSANVNIIFSLSRGTQLSPNEKLHPYRRGDNHRIVKIQWKILKNILQNHWDNFMWIWIYGIQDFSNEEQCSFPMKNKK